jgi:hypothetical protein
VRGIDPRIAFGSGNFEINHTDSREDRITRCSAAKRNPRRAASWSVGAVRHPAGCANDSFARASRWGVSEGV